MNRKHIFVLCLFFSLFSSLNARNTLDSLLQVYDLEIAKSDEYLAAREAEITRAKAVLHAMPESAKAAFEVAELYDPYQSDSAIFYFQMAVMLAQDSVPDEFQQALRYASLRSIGNESNYVHKYASLEEAPVDSHDYAIFAYELSIAAREAGDSLAYYTWLTRSAIADCRSAVTDNASSWMLAEVLMNQGDVSRAYRYIVYSLNNAAIFNARQRYVQIYPLSQLIDAAYRQHEDILRKRLVVTLVLLALLLVVLVLVVLYIVKQNKKLNTLYEKQTLLNGSLHTANAQLQSLNEQLSGLNKSLQEANLVKEQYICRYLEVYSDYIQRLSKMARKAGEKDPDGFLQREMNDFYRSFDNTFLSLYRNFVSDFNALLRPEERILPKQGELLTTELRIFALVRLGIDSSAKIAELLCYSPNTIYNYRARVKNAALGDRDDFENQVKKL